jgi:hypothetical protein
MFIYAKVGHSKFVEMHRDASDFYRSALVFYTRHWVDIKIDQKFVLLKVASDKKFGQHFP